MSESGFNIGTTDRKVMKTAKKKHRSANDSGGKFHNTRVSIRNVFPLVVRLERVWICVRRFFMTNQ